MSAIATLCWGNLRQRKMQNLLIALLIALSTLLISTAAAVLMNTENLFENRHQSAFGAHEIITLTEGYHDKDFVENWWAEQEGVHSSKLIPYKFWTGLSFKGAELTNLSLYMMSTPQMPIGVDNLLPAQGLETLRTPTAGSVWVPTSLAYKYGMKVGDVLDFTAGTEPVSYTIEAVVIDLSHGGPFATTARIWMNEENYEQIISSIEGNESYMLALRYDDLNESTTYWQRFEEQLQTPFLESRTTYNELSAFYFIMNKIIGFVMTFLGIVMIAIALFTISFTITDTILSSYRSIGITKSLGMQSKHIIAAYLLQYSLLAIAAIIPSLAGGSLLSDTIIQSSMSFLNSDIDPLSSNTTVALLLTGAALLLLIIGCVWLYTAKTRHIDPIQGIRYGMSEQQHSHRHKRISYSRLLQRWPVPAVISWRLISSNKRGSFLILLLTSITTAVLVFGTSLVTSISNMNQTAPQWGYDDGDIAIIVINNNGFSKQALEEDAREDQSVQSVNWSGSSVGVVPHTETEDAQSISLPLTVVEGSMDEIGFASLVGRNPQLANEISIGVNVASQLNKEVGDSLTLYIEGKRQVLLITGIYQSIANMSHNARITSELVDSLIPEAGYITLSNDADADQIVNRLTERYAPALQIVKQQVLLDSVFKEAAAGLLIPMGMMAVLFSTVTCLIVYSICRLNLRKEIKMYGIYAALGLTAASIRRALTTGVTGLAMLSAGIGAICGIYVLPAVLRGLLSSYGIVQLPLIVETPLVIALALCVAIIAAFGCWLSSAILQRTSLRMLIVE